MHRHLLPLFLAATAAACGSEASLGPNEQSLGSSDASPAGRQVEARAALPGSAGLDAASAAYAQAAVFHDLEVIRASELAGGRGRSEHVRQMAAMLAADHRQLLGDINRGVTALEAGAPLPTDLDDDGAQRLALLESTSDDEFDLTFLEQQRQHHQAALDTLEAYSRGGGALVRLAEEAEALETAHMQRLEDALSGQDASSDGHERGPGAELRPAPP